LELNDKTEKIIDAKGKIVFPGAIDGHVHLQHPLGGSYSADDFETGTRAAAAGGVTTIIDFAIPKKGEDPIETINKRKNEANDKVYVDYSLHGGITDWNDKIRTDLKQIIKDGISTFKMFMIYKSEGWMTTDATLRDALIESQKYGAMIQVHAESADIVESLIDKHHTEEEMKEHGAWLHCVTRPNITEYEAIQRSITWAEETGGHLLVVHMSTGEGANLVKKARSRGVNVLAETCPHYLYHNWGVFKSEKGHYFATCPQIKSENDRIRLTDGLSDGSIQLIGTDTCTFTTKQKDKWNGDFTKMAFGLPGSELMLPLLYNRVVEGKLSIHQMVALCSTNPAKIFGMYPQKGAILVGSDADIVIYDPKKETTIDYKNMETNCDWSPYQGMKITGYPHMTLVRGEIVAQEGKCVGKKGFGKFVKRGPSGNFIT
jgi:dihydropyrimidinase